MSEDDRFWLEEATLDDICDKDLSVEACLEVIIPELEKHVYLDDARILEIGCGVGRLTIPMKHKYPRARVIGIDISPRFLNMAEKNSGWVDNMTLAFEERKPPEMYPYFYCRDTIPAVRFARLNAVYTMTTFQHIPDEQKKAYIDQTGKALKKGGAIVFQYVEGTNQSRRTYDTTIDKVKEWCEEAGIQIKNIQHDLLFDRWTWITGVKL